MQHIGIDIIEISRIEKAVEEREEKFLHRIYTERELELCHNDPASLAARFAAKEAVIKALDAPDKGIRAKDIEILATPNSKPLVQLHGTAAKLAQGLGITGFAISLSHSRDYAIAMVIGETENTVK